MVPLFAWMGVLPIGEGVVSVAARTSAQTLGWRGLNGSAIAWGVLVMRGKRGRAQAVLAGLLAVSTLSVSGTSIQMSPLVGRRTEGLYRSASYNRVVDQYARQAEEDYTIKLSSLRLQLSVGLEARYDDNITSTDAGDKQDGLSLSPVLYSEVYWPLNPGFLVYSGLSLGYKWYAAGGEDANDKGVTVGGTDGAMNLQLGFDFRVGQDGLLSASEEYSRDLDAFDGGDQGNRDYTLNRNRLNLQYRNDFSHYTSGTAKFAHTNQWVDESEFDEQDLYSDFLDLVLLHFFTRDLQFGPYGRGGTYRYIEDKHNDSDALAGGLAMVYGTTERLVLSGSVGLSDVSFDTSNNPAATDSYTGLTTEWAIRYANSPLMTHRLVTTYGAEQGTLSQNVNFAKEWLTQYSISYVLRENLVLNGDLGYVRTRESDGGDNYELFRTGIGVGYRLTRDATVDLRYVRDWRVSGDSSGNEYTRNAVILRLVYRL